ncbi:histidine phosphatase family protein [Fodinicola acaciae]|uniref:histidine phosphatase family protein n=1 Tax=Fodinicola acaciae TaxID=2681555 RepID=UPI0013D6DDBD|nr:histidine phosphatase family protein [Fodinicola acaciae]
MERQVIAVRHGESAANAAFAIADRTGVEPTGLPPRDADVVLTETGRRQSLALGRWLAGLPSGERPQVIRSSVFVRARATAELISEAFTPAPPLSLDERLRDRDMGAFELLTAGAIRRRFPQESARRDRVGDLFYRPPGGESLADVGIRVRGVLAELDDHRTLIVAHDAVVLMLRYVLEGLSEDDLRSVVRDDPVRNSSVTRWRRRGDRWELLDYNRLDHLG